MKRLVAYLRTGWERLLFGCVGFACLGFTFALLWREQVAGASAVFAMAFFSFFYSNLARFKRFKGLGFEAEIWEDKQKEAAHLIERLKSIVSVYTREVIMGRVMRGRFGGSEKWATHWQVFDELQGRHNELGQDIDFSGLRREVEQVFMFDLTMPAADSIRKSIEGAKSAARASANGRFGNPIADIEGYGSFNTKLEKIASIADSLFERASTENIATTVLNLALDTRKLMQDEFGVEVEYRPDALQRLGVLSAAFRQRPIEVTPEMMAWADDHNAFDRYS